MTAWARSTWRALTVPASDAPQPLTIRVESMPPRSRFHEHQHDWHQLVYAISGVLIVSVDGTRFVIDPEHGAWVPAGVPHEVSSLYGCEFRSLWIENLPGQARADACCVLSVSPLLRSLINEAARVDRMIDAAYFGELSAFIFTQLRRAPRVAFALPWPGSGPLQAICEAIYEDPADPRELDHWGAALGVSVRTLARKFNSEVGVTFSAWRAKARVARAIEMLKHGESVTETAFTLGYASVSSFTFMFRLNMGVSPSAYAKAAGDAVRRRGAG